jgi:hypothetical protein
MSNVDMLSSPGPVGGEEVATQPFDWVLERREHCNTSKWQHCTENISLVSEKNNKDKNYTNLYKLHPPMEPNTSTSYIPV